MPDVELKGDTIPNIAFYLSASGQDSTEVMFDYVVEYIAKHPKKFKITDLHDPGNKRHRSGSLHP